MRWLGNRGDAPFYRVCEQTADEHNFAVYGEERSRARAHEYSWIVGAPIPSDVDLPVVFRASAREKLADVLLTNASQPLYSARAKDLVLAHSTCARPYPAEIWCGDRLVSSDYFVVNFERAFGCMNRSKSRFEVLAGSDSILSVRRLVLDVSRVPPGEQIFRLLEYRSYLVCTPAFRSAAVASGVSGFRFEPAQAA